MNEERLTGLYGPHFSRLQRLTMVSSTLSNRLKETRTGMITKTTRTTMTTKTTTMMSFWDKLMNYCCHNSQTC